MFARDLIQNTTLSKLNSRQCISSPLCPDRRHQTSLHLPYKETGPSTLILHLTDSRRKPLLFDDQPHMLNITTTSPQNFHRQHALANHKAFRFPHMQNKNTAQTPRSQSPVKILHAVHLISNHPTSQPVLQQKPHQ